MRSGSARTALLLVIVSMMPGCAGHPPPELWRPSAAQALHVTRGSWVVVEPRPAGADASGASPVAGELIAIDDDSIHVLTAGGLRSVARSSPHRLTVVGYRTPGGSVAAWAIGGGVSTLSHGGFLLFTAPMWAVVGIWAALSESGAGDVHGENLARAFARFPQGLPPGFDPEALGPLVTNPAARTAAPRR
jgi:hypothetical protein